SVAAATISNKISMVIPFTVNALYFHSSGITSWQLLALAIAMISIVLSSWPTEKNGSISWQQMFLPMIIFFMGGLIDTCLNYINMRLLQPSEQEIFPIFVFGSAAFAGIIIL